MSDTTPQDQEPVADGVSPASVEPSADSSTLLDRLEQFKKGAVDPAPTPAPEPTPQPKPEPKPAPEPVKGKGPLADVEPEPEDKKFNTPLDTDTDEPTSTDDGEDLPPNIKEGTPQAVAFKALRREKKEIMSQRDAAQAELDQIKARATELEGERAIREDLEQKVKEYEAKLNITRIEESPVYQKAVSEPVSKIAEATAKFADQYGVDLNQLDRVFDIADDMKRKAAFKELLSGLDIDPEDNLEIRALAKEYRTVATKREEILADSEKTLAELEAIQAKQAERDAALRAEERRGTAKDLGAHVARKLPMLKSLEGFDFDSTMESIGEADPDAIDLPNKLYNALAGQALPKVSKNYQQALLQIEQLTDEIEKLRNSGPRPGGSQPINTSSEAAKDGEDGLTVADRFKKTFGQR